MAKFSIGYQYPEPKTVSQYRDWRLFKRHVKYMSTNTYFHKLPDNSSTSTSFSSKNEGQPLTRLELKILDRVVINPLNINIFKDNNISLRSLVPIEKHSTSDKCSKQLDNPELARQRTNIPTFEGRLHRLSRVWSSENTFVPASYPFKYHNTILGARIKPKVIVPETIDMMNDLTTNNFRQSDGWQLGDRRSKYLHIRMYHRNLPNASCKIVCTSVEDAHLLVNRLRLKSLERVILDRLNINHFQDNHIRLRSAFPIAKRLRNYKSVIQLENTESPSSMRKSSQHKERSNGYNRSRGSDKDVMADKYLRDFHSKDREYCTKLIVIVPKRFVRIKDLLTRKL